MGIAGESVKLLLKGIVRATEKWVEFDHEVHKSFREIGFNGQQLHNISKSILEDTKAWGRQYGMTREEILRVNESLTKIHKTTAQFSQQTRQAYSALSKVYGDATVSKFTEKMAEFGMHAKSATAWMGKGVVQAKSMGLNAQKFTDQMAQSADLMHKMHFQTGITGLQKMVGLAQRLGTSVEKLTAHIDIDSGNFSDIEKSIESAANLQRLGGSWAANFGNPLEVMAEGMFDAESSMERVLKAIDGKATFNRATGQMDMSWYDSKQLGQAAQALGMDPKELRQVAKRQAMGNAIDEDLRKGNANFSKFSETDLEAIKNLAEFDADTGKFTVSYVDKHGNTQTQNIEDLTQEQLKEAVALTENEENINRNVATIAGQVKDIANAMGAGAKDTTSLSERFKGAVSSLGSTVVDWLGLDGITNWFNGLLGHEKGGIVSKLESVPKFETGGVQMVPGNSTTGDKILTRVNSGEMILNKAQQGRLFAYLDGKSIPRNIKGFANGGVAGGANVSNGALPIIYGKGLSKTINVIASPKFERTMTGVINKTSKLVENSYRLIPTNVKELGRLKDLTKTIAKANFNPLSVLSRDNSWVRLLSRKLNASNSGVGRATGKFIEGASLGLDKIRGSIRGFGSRIGGAWNRSFVGSELRTLGKDIVKAGKFITRPFTYIGGKIGSAAQPLVKNIQSLGSSTGKIVKDLAKSTAELGGKVVKGIGSKTVSGIGKAAKGLKSFGGKASEGIVNATGKLLGKNAAKFVKGAGPIGTAISAGMALWDAGKAISNYSDIEKDINNRGDLSRKQKRELLRGAQDDRNEQIGAAAGTAIGAALGSAIPIPVIGTMAGAWIGEKVGGFIGKSVNNIKDFLFGKDAELSEEDEAQLDYEESKMGEVSIEDPQLMEKAAMATCAMHDLLISIWHHMNGKAPNGEEQKKGFLSNAADAVGSIAQGALGILTAPFSAIGSLFSKKKKSNSEVKDNDYKKIIAENVVGINENLSLLLGGGISDGLESESWYDRTQRILATGEEEPVTVIPEPIGSNSASISESTKRESGNFNSSVNNTVRVDVGGIIRVEAGNGIGKDFDFKKLLDDPQIQARIQKIVLDGLDTTGNSGRFDLNSDRYRQRGAFTTFVNS